MSRRQRANTSAANNLSLSEVMCFVEKRDRRSGPVAARESMLPYDGFVPPNSTCRSKKTQRISHLQFSCLKKKCVLWQARRACHAKTRHHLNDFHVQQPLHDFREGASAGSYYFCAAAAWGGGRQNLEGGGGMSGDLTVFCGAKRNPHDFCQAPAEQMTTSLQKVSTTHSKSKALHFLSLNF